MMQKFFRSEQAAHATAADLCHEHAGTVFFVIPAGAGFRPGYIVTDQEETAMVSCFAGNDVHAYGSLIPLPAEQSSP